MKVLFSILLIIPFNCLIGQLELPEGKHPYNKFIEWPEVGYIFMNHHPSGKGRDFNFTFINTNGEVQWQETIYPKKFELTPIVSNESNYIYFIESFEINKNKLPYHQINKSGSVISTSIDFLRDLKKHGYNTPDEAIVQNVINTSSALVFQLLLENKSKKQFDHILFFLTHHNHRTYSVKMEPTSYENHKEKNTSHPYFAGSKGGDIYFTQLSATGNIPKAIFYQFDEKGKQNGDVVLKLSNFSPIPTQVMDFTMQGIFNTNKHAYFPNNLGFAFYQDSRFYFAQQNEKTKTFEIFCLNDENKLEKIYTSAKFEIEKRRFDASLKLAYDGSSWFLGSAVNGNTELVFINGEKVTSSSITDLNLFQNAKNNFSIFSHPERLNEYILPTETGILSIERSELPNSNITLKRKQ